MMDQDYEREKEKCGVRKNHLVEITVKKYNGPHDCKGSGELLLHIKERGFCSVHGFLKRIYESIPEYKGKCLWICVHDLSNGQVGIYTHIFKKNRIPFRW